MTAGNQTPVNFVPTKLFVGFYLVPAVTPHCIEMGRVTALASDSGLEGGAGHAPEPPRLQTPHLSVYPAFFPLTNLVRTFAFGISLLVMTLIQTQVCRFLCVAL